MSEESLLSDELLRQLVAVGHVDILVGVPTLNNAGTIVDVVRAAQGGLATYFPRARTVLINSDAGSDDGTPALVRGSAAEDGATVTATHRLRTTHRISTPYHGLPGKGSALRTLFAVADLLNATALAVLDPDVTGQTPEWVASLVRPVTHDGADLVAPMYARAPLDSPLVTQFVRPLVRAVYGWQVREPLVGEFGCSGRFAAHCVEQPVWQRPFARDGVDVWVPGEALVAGFRVAQAALGPRIVTQSRHRPGLPDLFRQVVGAVFETIGMHAEYCLPRVGSEPLPSFGTLDAAPPAAAPSADVARMADTFARDVADLRPVLASILAPDTLQHVADAAAGGAGYADDVWAATVYDALLAHHQALITREHVMQALLPLYLGRTASFLQAHGTSPPCAIEQSLDSLGVAFERLKPRIVERWHHSA